MERCSKFSPEANVHREAWPAFWVAFAVLTAAPSPFWAEWECPKGWTVPAGHCCVTAWRHHCSSWFLASLCQCPSTETPGAVQQGLGPEGSTERPVLPVEVVSNTQSNVCLAVSEVQCAPMIPLWAGPAWDSPFKRQSKLLVSLDKPKEKKKLKPP